MRVRAALSVAFRSVFPFTILLQFPRLMRAQERRLEFASIRATLRVNTHRLFGMSTLKTDYEYLSYSSFTMFFYTTATLPFFTMPWERTILRDGATAKMSLRSSYRQLPGRRHGKFSRPLVLSAQFRLFHAKLAQSIYTACLHLNFHCACSLIHNHCIHSLFPLQLALHL